jgi:predicted nucleic acid-binding protein
LHVAVMQRHGIGRVLSFDRHFDEVPGIERVA